MRLRAEEEKLSLMVLVDVCGCLEGGFLCFWDVFQIAALCILIRSCVLRCVMMF